MSELSSPKLKNGFLTTEFWVTLATSAVGFAVVLGYLTPEQANDFVKAVVSVVGGLVTIISTVTYLYGRIKLKQVQMQNSTTIDSLLGQNEPINGGSGSSTYVE